MTFAKRMSFAAVAVGSLVMTGAGIASADTGAIAVTNNNPGLLSGFAAPTVTSNPLNNCGNYTPAGASLLSGTAGDTCLTD
ncbi:chaplin family protein [Streptomyces sp. MB22_4]|uniref:chaplin family protein n=1 Tax=Streptomyces sp. MB22_4 TaxID=3383120 RepID=UPI00399F506B